MTKKKLPKPHVGQLDRRGIVDAFARRLHYSIAKDEYTASDFDMFQALAYSVRDQLIDRWFRTQDLYYKTDAKRVYYLSLEFLLGRALSNNILNLGATDAYRAAMEDLGCKLEDLETRESDAGLGNGGLGRLAACFLDSAATVEIPFYGYGIRYEYGIFRQRIIDGYQVEAPDNWLRYGNPWEIPRPDVLFPIKFYGRTATYRDEKGEERFQWVDTSDVYAMAYDMPIVGFRNDTVNTLRLWAAKASREFDLAHFNAGDYVRSVEDKNKSENISKVLYPADDQYAGKELRLKQQYFFVAATLQDVIRRFKKQTRAWDELPQKVAVQLNDTHPSIAIPELMRVLLDTENLPWDVAWDITERVFGYTNHTILSEALEVWPVDILGRLLPRHLQIIEEIDRRLRGALLVAGYEPQKISAMGIVENQRVRMANLAIVGSHSVNGVAKMHSDILKASTFADFHRFYPGRFNNKTNGITPRRWLIKANPKLSELICEAIGDRWMSELDELRNLEQHVEDPVFREKWDAVQVANKERLLAWSQKMHGISFDPLAMLDCQIKRIHEYKRQLLNALHALALYHRVADGVEIVPRTIFFGGKTAPAYFMAKLIIKLINSIAELIQSDPKSKDKLQVVYFPNYDVTSAEMLFPACDLSEQISTAGTEASGTGNMKAALNGGLIIGTLDGANIEILEEIGADNMFIFGHTEKELRELRERGYDSRKYIEGAPELKRAIESIAHGTIGKKYPGVFQPIVDMLLGNDRYFHCADFQPYIDMQKKAAETFLDRGAWDRKSILSTARMGKFSSDRTIHEYARDIWDARPAIWQK